MEQRSLKALLIAVFGLMCTMGYSQGLSCNAAEPFCSDSNGELIFPNATGVPNSGTIGCLNTTPNPAWYFLQIDQTGDLQFQIIQNTNFDLNGNPIGTGLDVDFIAWGPFNNATGSCATLADGCDSNGDGITSPVDCPNNTSNPNYYLNDLDNTNIIDCSYSGAAVESFTILNAQPGDVYVLLITNFQGSAGSIKLEQTNFGAAGAGSTDCSIVAGSLGPDQNVCDGDTVTLDGTTAGATSYEWYVDTNPGDGIDNFVLIAGETNPTLVINNDQTGIYQSVVSDGTSTGSDEVVVTFFSIPTANTVTDLRACDTFPNDGIASTFDTSNVETEVLGGQTGVTVTYFDGAGNPLPSPLPNPFTNATANTETITVRVANTGNINCFAETTFTLNVDAAPEVNFVPDIQECDSDNDGFANTFDTSGVQAAVLGGQTDVTVEYFDGAMNPLPTPLPNPITNASPGTETITIRLTNNTTGCQSQNTFDLIANPYPIASTPPNMIQCDDVSNDGAEIFDLSTRDAAVLGAQLASQFEITYHLSQSDAQNDTGALNPMYPYSGGSSDTGTSQTIYVRMENVNNPACFDAFVSFTITLFTSGVVNTPPDIYQCDDGSFNGVEGDGIGAIDFSTLNTSVLGGQDATQFTVGYFPTQADAVAGSNEIIGVYNNPVAYQSEQIWVKVENNNNTDCEDIQSFNFFVNQMPIANTPALYALCDDNAHPDGDGIAEFDLASRVSEVLGTQDATLFDVTFHDTQADADANASALPLTYMNQDPNSEEVFVRIENVNDTSCYRTTSFFLQVDEQPTAYTVMNIDACDDSVGDYSDGVLNNGVGEFDFVTDLNMTVLNGQSAANFTISYHLDPADLPTGANALTMPYNNTNATETIHVRIANNVNPDCFDSTSFTITVHPQAEAFDPGDYILCDDDTIPNNGFTTFDLSTLEADILGAQDPNVFDVTFHVSEAFAEDGTAPLDTMYDNQIQDVQTLWARVFPQAFPECDAVISFELIVTPIPEILDWVDEIPFCVNEGFLDIGIDPMNPNYTYEWTDAASNVVGNTPIVTITASGVYTLVVTNNENGIQCPRTYTIDAFPSENPTITNVEIQEFSENNTITVTVEGVGEYEYRLDFGPWQTSNVFENVLGGDHTVFVRDANGCNPIDTEDVLIIDYPRFFTPNGDGYHDTWNITGIYTKPTAKIYIFDRFGKLIKQLSPVSGAWDGTFNGQALPATDYWFKVIFPNDQGVEREFRGHFTLKR